MTCRATIIGTGSYLPRHVMSNKELEKIVKTSDEWIQTRTGIKSRRIAGAGEETSIMASRAGLKAMEMAGVNAPELDMIIVGTITPDMVMPSCACLVQKEIGAENAFAFDVSAACSGYSSAPDTCPGTYPLITCIYNLFQFLISQDAFRQIRACPNYFCSPGHSLSPDF